MTNYIDVEGMQRAALRMEQAALEASRAADRFEEVLYKLTPLIGDGYGNNLCRLIELLEELPETGFDKFMESLK